MDLEGPQGVFWVLMRFPRILNGFVGPWGLSNPEGVLREINASIWTLKSCMGP